MGEDKEGKGRFERKNKGEEKRKTIDEAEAGEKDVRERNSREAEITRKPEGGHKNKLFFSPINA